MEKGLNRMETKYFVAKSYQQFERQGEPFKNNGKMYVAVVSPRGIKKVVRAYTEKEFLSMYATKGAPIASTATKSERSEDDEYSGWTASKYKDDPYYKPDKEKFGFSKGYITIFAGDISTNEEFFFNEPNCYYNIFFGWYVPSTCELPHNLPAELKPVKLNWEVVAEDDENLKKDKAAIQKTIKELTYTGFHFPFALGETITQEYTIMDVNDNASLFHFKDNKGNLYEWQASTSHKELAAGANVRLRGIIKDRDFYQNLPCTVLTRCWEVREDG